MTDIDYYKSRIQRSRDYTGMAASGSWPSFPLPDGSYFGPRAGYRRSVSGYATPSDRYQVEILQEALTMAGYPVECDGLFGPRTLQAVVGIQRARKLAVDGLVGRETWDTLWCVALWPRDGEGL